MATANRRNDPRNDPSVAAFTARRAEAARRHRARVAERARAPEAERRAETAAEAATESPTESSVAESGSATGPGPRAGGSRRRRMLTAGALGAAVMLLLSGCGLPKNGLYDIPLPGGADLGDNPITAHIRMANVYDLVPQAAVKFHNVTIGKITKITLANKQHGPWQADVAIQVNRKQAQLPANATGEIRQTSLLGEKYVELVAPQNGQGHLADNATLKENPSYNHVEIEQIFGALSLLLNDGGLPQIRTIAQELNNVTSGHEGDIRGLLTNVNHLVGTLDDHSDDIVKALDNVNQLSKTLNQQKGKLTSAIDSLQPGLATLRDQRTQLVQMLQAMQHLSGVTVDTLNKTHDDLITDLKSLQPSLQKLADSGDSIAKSLPMLATFPFSDYAAKAMQGDYENLYADVDLNLNQVIKNLGRSRQNFIGQMGVLPPSMSGLTGGTPPQPGQPDAGTGAGTYPNYPSNGSSGTSGRSTQSGSTGQSTGSGQTNQAPQGGTTAPAPNTSSGGGLGGIFGTLTNGGA